MLQYLTKRQREILDFIDSFIREKAYSPSLGEICSGVGLSSLATVHVHLRNLEKKKMIRRAHNQSRAIELNPSARHKTIPPAAENGIVELPLLGTVAAGKPIEAIEDNQTIQVPEEFVRGNETFVLRVKGDSMIEEQICSGDMVIVEKRSHAENGEMVVALIDETECTVKKFYGEPDGIIRLQPANATMEPMFLPADRCTIQGVVIGLLRKY